MDNESGCGTFCEDFLYITGSSSSSDVLAKLRRLKIQENIITASLLKCVSDQDDNAIENLKHNLEWKMLYTDKISNDINEIKNAFEDIKTATSDSEDNFKNINIADITKDVLNLNSKIRSVEEFINTELSSLKLEEKELIKQMNEEPKPEIKSKGKGKIQNKQYNEVVPSPVRVLINSPLKCNEVQQFQAFMSKSKNRYGGWNEYNHNKFIQIWNKFYATEDIVSLEYNMKDISRNNILPHFKDEVYAKFPGIQLNDIILHSKWYSEFCYLKRAQQAAVDKWRDNRRKIKGRQEKVKEIKSILKNADNEKLSRKQNETYIDQKSTGKELRAVKDITNTMWDIYPGGERENVIIGNGLLHDYEFERDEYTIASNTASEGSLTIQEEKIDQKIPITNAVQNQIICKPKSSTFAMPTQQWINRCYDNSVKEVFRYTNNNIDSVDKLCIPNWRLSLHKYSEDKRTE